ncbi:ATP-binding protein [Streptomyces sp. NPDC006446]|uniref:ATP-binding protein n=1 Tax=Streptomyces sp. NPDC006446 TaxID=3154301 RepID=UPI0033A2D218
MTASRAQRRGPWPSPDPEIPSPRHETRAVERAVRTAGDLAGRARPTEGADTSAPAPSELPGSPATSRPSPAPGRPVGSTPSGTSVRPLGSVSSEAAVLPAAAVPPPAPGPAAGSVPHVAPALPVDPTPAATTVPRATPAIPVPGAHLARTTVPAHPSRASGVRDMVAEHLGRLRLPSECVDNAVLATDELFVNAIEHGSPDRGDTVTVTVECGPRELRVSVADRSSALPGARKAGGAEESGRGLAIVAALTDDWGIAPADPGITGKKVWFSVVLQGEP